MESRHFNLFHVRSLSLICIHFYNNFFPSFFILPFVVTHFRIVQKTTNPIPAKKAIHFQGYDLLNSIVSVFPTNTGPAQYQRIDFSFETV